MSPTNMERPMKPLTKGDLADIEARKKAKVEADAKIGAILAKNKRGERFEITPRMRREAKIRALQDGNLDK